MKREYFLLLPAILFLCSCSTGAQSKTVMPENETVAESTGMTERYNEAGTAADLPEPDLLDEWLGSYQQSGIWRDEIRTSLDFYIYREDGTYYGYLCVSGSEAGTSCYFNERILTEIRGNRDVIEVYFLEKQQLVQGCLHEEYPDIFGIECGESKLDKAIRIYGSQDLLFLIIRDGDTYSITEGEMSLGKDQDGMPNDFSRCGQLTMADICDNDKEIFLKMFRESEHLNELEQPDYNCYDNNGELMLNLYLDPENERGVGIYYGKTQVSRYMTKFEIESWQSGIWEDNKYSLMRAGEAPVTSLDEYQEYREYNDRGQISSFYSEGMITGWSEPEKERLVQVDFFYRDDGTLEQKRCHYNHRLYGTTRQGETFYFNAREQLTYATAYITHGMLSDYYFYEDGKEEPVYCLTLDHMGQGCYGELLTYDYASSNNELLTAENPIWQDVYAEMLQKLSGNEFYLCDIDGNGTPELLIGGPSTDTDKYSEFDVYTYRDSKAECLGSVSTLRSSSLWLDDNCGILGYSYGAGSGGTHRYYMEDGLLNYDDEVSGYYYSEGNQIEWFRDMDGSKIIVTDENRNEHDRIWKSLRSLERYIVTDETIQTVIYGGV